MPRNKPCVRHQKKMRRKKSGKSISPDSSSSRLSDERRIQERREGKRREKEVTPTFKRRTTAVAAEQELIIMHGSTVYCRISTCSGAGHYSQRAPVFIFTVRSVCCQRWSLQEMWKIESALPVNRISFKYSFCELLSALFLVLIFIFVSVMVFLTSPMFALCMFKTTWFFNSVVVFSVESDASKLNLQLKSNHIKACS